MGLYLGLWPARLAFVLALGLFATTESVAQEASRLGVVVKASFVPQAGLLFQLSEGVALRALGYLEAAESDVEGIGGVSVLFSRPSERPLRPYVGVDATALGFSESDALLGLLAGSRYRLGERFEVFGEVQVGLVIDEGIGRATMYNTGAGITFYFKRR